MSQVNKTLLRIVMMRVRQKIKPKIAEEQCGLVKGKWESNKISMRRTTIERAVEVQKKILLFY